MTTIDVKTAVKSAYSYAQSLQELMGSDWEDIRLEEIELSEDQKTWFVTLGYDIQVKRKSVLDEMVDPLHATLRFQREYKLFAVNATTGEIESMKIRQV